MLENRKIGKKNFGELEVIRQIFYRPSFLLYGTCTYQATICKMLTEENHPYYYYYVKYVNFDSQFS